MPISPKKTFFFGSFPKTSTTTTTSSAQGKFGQTLIKSASCHHLYANGPDLGKNVEGQACKPSK